MFEKKINKTKPRSDNLKLTEQIMTSNMCNKKKQNKMRNNKKHRSEICSWVIQTPSY